MRNRDAPQQRAQAKKMHQARNIAQMSAQFHPQPHCRPAHVVICISGERQCQVASNAAKQSMASCASSASIDSWTSFRTSSASLLVEFGFAI